jgi:DNA-binding CsgD family transcriptional regulator
LFTKTEKRIIDALVEGKTRKQIAQELGITRKNLRDLIYLLRKKHREETPKTGGE